MGKCTSARSYACLLACLLAMLCYMSIYRITTACFKVWSLRYTTSVVHFPYIDELLSSSARNLVGEFLACQRFPCSFYNVHLVA